MNPDVTAQTNNTLFKSSDVQLPQLQFTVSLWAPETVLTVSTVHKDLIFCLRHVTYYIQDLKKEMKLCSEQVVPVFSFLEE